MLLSKDEALHYTHQSERVQIEAWGPNALRVRATRYHSLPSENWALTIPPPRTDVAVSMREDYAAISNGNISATISKRGKITIKNSKGTRLLEEKAEAREFKPMLDGDYHLIYRLESNNVKEKIYGMGQHQPPHPNLKGIDMGPAQRSPTNVPFMLSNIGYGLLWNNPAVGRAVLDKNTMCFEARSTRVLDYWIVSCEEPSEIIEAYADVTGKVPMTPDQHGLGSWQCKLRNHTPEELLDVAREYKKRGLPLDVVMVDFFNWPKQGEWKFDPTYWKEPGESAMRRLLSSWTSTSSTSGLESFQSPSPDKMSVEVSSAPSPNHTTIKVEECDSEEMP